MDTCKCSRLTFPTKQSKPQLATSDTQDSIPIHAYFNLIPIVLALNLTTMSDVTAPLNPHTPSRRIHLFTHVSNTAYNHLLTPVTHRDKSPYNPTLRRPCAAKRVQNSRRERTRPYLPSRSSYMSHRTRTRHKPQVTSPPSHRRKAASHTAQTRLPIHALPALQHRSPAQTANRCACRILHTVNTLLVLVPTSRLTPHPTPPHPTVTSLTTIPHAIPHSRFHFSVPSTVPALTLAE